MFDQSDIQNATGSDFCGGYREIMHVASLEQVRSYCDSMRRVFVPIAKQLTPETNSVWILRHYLAIKLIAAASVLAGSSRYAKAHNLQAAVPYFNYYAAFNVCRAYLVTCPQITWEGEQTMTKGHERILNQTADLLRLIDPRRRQEWRAQLERLRECRELFSYRFPLTGPSVGQDADLDPERTIQLCRLIAELASINSEVFESTLKRHARPDMPVVELPDHRRAAVFQLAGGEEVDDAEKYRIGKYLRGWKTISTLDVMTSDGLFDDLLGAWSDKSGLDDSMSFDADDCSDLLLRL